MDFDFSDEQHMFQESIRRFCQKELTKEVVRKWDEEEAVPPEIWSQMAHLGWVGTGLPEEYGGSGGTIIDQVILLEELSRCAPVLACRFITTCSFGGRTIFNNGSDAQKKFFLPKMIQGELLFCLGLTDPGGGTDILGSLKTTADLQGNDFVINGQKVFISDSLIADYIIIVARTDKNPPKKAKGLSLIIANMKSKGIEARKIRKLGVKPSEIAEIFFTDV
ncbi:MAG: acyl-CoA dehydrogenase family protein, partial [Pseudomonadota bacterium]